MVTNIIFILLCAVVLAFLAWVLIKVFNKKTTLPSGKPVPKKEKLWNMTANDLAREYSKEDLKWLKRYILRKIGELNSEEFSSWSDANRNVHIALCGWKGK